MIFFMYRAFSASIKLFVASHLSDESEYRFAGLVLPVCYLTSNDRFYSEKHRDYD
jgi:hypothetical protein